ncbi:hypothetical protein [Solicola gregarius]|uniref:Uncharacterized protein n=1 Tax=Solicola gregarius TaxID=2908642 RepID=A0AA46TM02_9ACTN|nr:hypothetical protein [Solicola gregarius]UYM07520.1 hypothetical protein L0C25_10755 [Solicola gregarius]
MSEFPSSRNFSRHCDNLNEVLRTITQIARTHKRAIRERDAPAELALRKVHTLMIGVFAETRLRKIIDDPTGFNAHERRVIWRHSSQDGRWRSSVDLAARKHWSVPTGAELRLALPQPARDRVLNVLSLLRGELAPIITHRNKLAHGQWVWQLKSQSDDQFLSTPHDLDYNYAAIASRQKTLEFIARLVHVLCVSEPTFDRDFDHIASDIRAEQSRLDGSDYDAFAETLRRSHSEGLRKRGIET